MDNHKVEHPEHLILAEELEHLILAEELEHLILAEELVNLEEQLVNLAEHLAHLILVEELVKLAEHPVVQQVLTIRVEHLMVLEFITYHLLVTA